jgi:type IV pilus assembly protein PilM
MAKSYPPDVLVLDTESLLHARMGRGAKGARVTHVKNYRLAGNTFASAVVTPELVNEQALAETLRRLRSESGKWDRASLLLPDSWFRINILELPSLPDRAAEAMEMVRWSLKRTIPIAPEDLRVAYEVLSRDMGKVKVLVISAVEKTLAAIERVFTDAGLEVILIEPVGLNIWNAIAVREPVTATGDRVFLYVRSTDFTTAVFRGSQPLFIRSRNLSGERTLQQEIRLSASYLRDSLQATGYDTLYIAGNSVDSDVRAELATSFSAPVRVVALRDFVEDVPSGFSAHDAELTACTGVFTG